ncbi:hypothetical protein PINS_up014564 [Pythium insidiosum]|nr:hypothetical protein PINS_up014564 [Pythium insidiosum]
MLTVAVEIARHVPAFEAPGREHHTLRRSRRSLPVHTHCKSWGIRCDGAPARDHFMCPVVIVARTASISVAVDDGDIYAFLQFLFSSSHTGPDTIIEWRAQVLSYLFRIARLRAKGSVAVWTRDQQCFNDWISLIPHSSQTTESSPPPSLLVLFTFRPNPLLPLNLGSARRAVKFVHGVVALVTANAYISTLGGGHFLCLHLHQAKIMARLQIAISAGLNDPVLASKCRVNLAYNAMRGGKFRKARRIIEEERVVARELNNNEELEKICHAAEVYLVKTIRLHEEFEQRRRELSAHDRAVVDNFYRQRVVRKPKPKVTECHRPLHRK